MSAGNVFVPDTIRRQPGVIWDRLLTAAGAATAVSYQFFSVGVGGAKTKTDTNLRNGNRLNPPAAFKLYSLGFIFGSGMLITDVQNFIRNYYFELTIGEAVLMEGPLDMFPGGAGVYFSSTQTALGSVANGFPSVEVTRRFPDYALTIPANVYFGVEVRGISFGLTAAAAFPNMGTGLDLRCVLDGLHDKGVQ